MKRVAIKWTYLLALIGRLQLIWIEFERGVTAPPYFTKVVIN